METLFERTPATTPAKTSEPPARARFAVALCFFLNGVLFATWVSRIPVIQTSLGMSHAVLGLVLFGLALGALLAMPAAGWCISRFGSARVSRLVSVIFVAMMPVLTLAPNAVVLTAILFNFGAFHGAFDVTMNAQAVAVENRWHQPIMSSFHALWSFGCLVGAGLGGLAASAGIAPFTHFAAAALLLGAPTLLIALPWLLDARATEVHRPLPHDKTPRGFVWPPAALVALGAVAFCIMMGEGAMADWGAIFLRRVANASEGIAATGYAAFSLTMAATRFLGDTLSARFGPVALVRGGSALAAAGLALALLTAQPIPVLIGFGAVGAGFATIVPQVFTAAGRVPSISAGPALAITTTLGYTGFLIGPPLIGFIAEAIGLRAALAIIVFTSLTAITLARFVGSAPKHE
jgi:MFS family permease